MRGSYYIRPIRHTIAYNHSYLFYKSLYSRRFCKSPQLGANTKTALRHQGPNAVCLYFKLPIYYRAPRPCFCNIIVSMLLLFILLAMPRRTFDSPAPCRASVGWPLPKRACSPLPSGRSGSSTPTSDNWPSTSARTSSGVALLALKSLTSASTVAHCSSVRWANPLTQTAPGDACGVLRQFNAPIGKLTFNRRMDLLLRRLTSF